jgi:hypothetical protein
MVRTANGLSAAGLIAAGFSTARPVMISPFPIKDNLVNANLIEQE